MENEPLKMMTFVQACKFFFGSLPGQSLMDFAQELRALTPNDKLELIEMFKAIGIDATKVN